MKTAGQFIDFLLARDAIDAEKAAFLHSIERTRLMFGMVALRHAFINSDQLHEVLMEQVEAEYNY